MDPVHERGSMDPVQTGGPWTPGPCFVLTHFGGHQSLCLLNSLRSKNMLKQGKCLKFLKLTTKPKVLEKLKRSWKKSWN